MREVGCTMMGGMRIIVCGTAGLKRNQRHQPDNIEYIPMVHHRVVILIRTFRAGHRNK
jgi:hypothetical protein